MTDQSINEPMMEMYYYETSQYLEQLERSIINSEKSNNYDQSTIDEVFRIMHNIKSSSAMMLYNNISILAHSIEDLFYFIREKKPQNVDYSALSDLILEGVDFIKVELAKIKNGDSADGDNNALVGNIKEFLALLKQQNPSGHTDVPHEEEESKKQHFYIGKDNTAVPAVTYAFKILLFFQEGCEMENIRAYAIVHNLKEFVQEIRYYPEDIIENDKSLQIIKEQGFKILIKTERTYNDMMTFFNQTAFVRDLEIVQLENGEDFEQLSRPKYEQFKEAQARTEKEHSEKSAPMEKELLTTSTHQSIISVNVDKLDKLMDLVGEMVIAEAMVTQNPDLRGMLLENFKKAARQLRKITSEVQDMVMSIRMVPLTTTFQKMNRIVRDMSKKLNKEVELELIGEETEVDKNVIEHVSDPLMHLVRNALDHGIENKEERERKGKTEPGKVIIEARNAGSEVLIIVRDNGKGLDKDKILKRAEENGLLNKLASEMSDKEIYNLIFLPGFSTKEKVTEFSGRGVGMDVVMRNIETVGGSVQVDSTPGEGSTVTLKIPLTLAIIEGMNIAVGDSRYTIPINSIKESFRPKENDIITDPDGSEMIMVRGQCYPILRLHEMFSVRTKVTAFTDGILIMVENEDKKLCLFADKLLGQQQVVVKALPNYLKGRKIMGLAGCTLLGDGSISLILDIAGFLGI